ncbi:hypothetical protein ACFQX4_22010 [Roseomonas sp. GCM10028921]
MLTPAPRGVILVTTHFVDRWMRCYYRRLLREKPENYDLFLLVRTEDGAPATDLRLNSICASHGNLRQLGYPSKCAHGTDAQRDFYHAGNVDLPLLNFHRQHPGYDLYWNIEYDVGFSGNWSTFFSATEKSNADLLATCLRRRAEHPDWFHWHTFAAPEGQGFDNAELITGFMPIFRASARAIAAVDAAYRAGCSGHLEAVWPTIVEAAGLTVEDIGGEGSFVAPGNTNRFYTSSPLAPGLAPGSVAFKPVRLRPGREPNMLWHPVKPFARVAGPALQRRIRSVYSALGGALGSV